MSGEREELELKARIEDPEALRRALLAAGAELVYRGAMLDRRFDRKGRLEGRDEVVRLRVFRPADGGHIWGMLGWKGRATRVDGYRRREEWESRVEDPKAVLVVLRRMGYKIVLRVDRAVEQFRLGEATVRLEWYPQMDVLAEVEGPPAQIEHAIAATGLPRASFLPESLPFYTAAYEERTGRAARLSRVATEAPPGS
jgi:adenylate cyclase class IV